MAIFANCLNFFFFFLWWVTSPPRHLHSSMSSPPPRSLPRTASRAEQQRRTCSAAGTSGTPWEKTDAAGGRLLIQAMHISKSFTDIYWINASSFLFFFFFSLHSHFCGCVTINHICIPLETYKYNPYDDTEGKLVNVTGLRSQHIPPSRAMFGRAR